MKLVSLKSFWRFLLLLVLILPFNLFNFVCMLPYHQNHAYHHLSQSSSQPLQSVTIFITTTTICHYFHHNHHNLSLLSSQPPSVNFIIAITTICHFYHLIQRVPLWCCRNLEQMFIWTLLQEKIIAEVISGVELALYNRSFSIDKSTSILTNKNHDRTSVIPLNWNERWGPPFEGAMASTKRLWIATPTRFVWYTRPCESFDFNWTRSNILLSHLKSPRDSLPLKYSLKTVFQGKTVPRWQRN